MQGSKETPEPPGLELGDPGLRWTRDGAVLHIRRRVSLRAVLFPLLMLTATVTIGTVSLRAGDPWVGGFMVFASIFPMAYLSMRVVQRAEVVVDGDGIRWHQSRPRPFHGRWARDRVDGLRIHVHAKSRWLEPRQAHVELRVDGTWKTFLFSGSLRRAERFANDLALATALSPDRTEADA